MRQRLIWIEASLVAVSAVVFALALGFGGSRTQFAFLKDHKPLARPFGWSAGPTAVVYTFRGDYEQTVRAARTELLASGYRDMTEKGVRYVAAFTTMPQTAPYPDPNDSHWVVIYKDYSLRDGYRQPVAAKGWVLVHMHGKPLKTVFDRMRAWLGL
jgi:hypothetical protein